MPHISIIYVFEFLNQRSRVSQSDPFILAHSTSQQPILPKLGNSEDAINIATQVIALAESHMGLEHTSTHPDKINVYDLAISQ